MSLDSISTHKAFVVEGEPFEWVKNREFESVTVYKGTRGFLRTGPREILEPQVRFQKHLSERGFPVPHIIQESNDTARYFCIEETFAGSDYASTCAEDCRQNDHVSDQHFIALTQMVQHFVQSQIDTRTECSIGERMSQSLLRSERVCSERPHLEALVQQATEKIHNELLAHPTVYTHGDFHPENIFSDGAIDTGHPTVAPLGYDVCTAIYATYIMGSSDPAHEPVRTYHFDAEHIAAYFRALDEQCVSQNLPPLSSHKGAFIVMRAQWAVVGLDRWPDTQQWRYELYSQLLNAYLAGNDVEQVLLSFQITS